MYDELVKRGCITGLAADTRKRYLSFASVAIVGLIIAAATSAAPFSASAVGSLSRRSRSS